MPECHSRVAQRKKQIFARSFQLLSVISNEASILPREIDEVKNIRGDLGGGRAAVSCWGTV